MRFLFILFITTILTSAYGQRQLHGHVRNDDGELLEFAVIYVEGSKLSTTTDHAGYYILHDVPSGALMVNCSYLGYLTQRISITADHNGILNIIMHGHLYNLPEVEIKSNSNKITLFPASNNLDKEQLRKDNLGQDVPVLLQWMPSVTMTSDAGAGIGYTSMRIRGVDQSRINVTINDVPLNESESQGVFWVDLPDFASSTEQLKIQRGVGPSTNGTGAYGGTVALNSFGLSVNPYAEVNASIGSFDTRKLSVTLNSGLMNNQYNIEARYSNIQSDGYIDRASSDLSSWYIEAAKVNSKSSLRFLVYSGKERTYQAWSGAPEALINGDKTALLNHYNNNKGSIYKNESDSINLFDSDRRYNLYQYKDQVDQYTQTHSQLHWARNFSKKITAKLSGHYTRGIGYFEQFRFNDKLANYGLPPLVNNNDTITRSDIVRRRWLDNHFYGAIAKIEMKVGNTALLSLGGGQNFYDGDHYGYITQLSIDSSYFPTNAYYMNRGDKVDGNIYLRYETMIHQKWNVSGDLQYRKVNYKVLGIDNDLRTLDLHKTYQFFNPKLAINYLINQNHKVLASFAVANREPDRSDFLDNAKNTLPLHESLYDGELAYVYSKPSLNIEANAYMMYYKNQLVITGELNDVGNNLRTNTPNSYRAGIEIDIKSRLSSKWNWQLNTTLSRNKINHFIEVIYDYEHNTIIKNGHNNVDISFSPRTVLANVFSFRPYSHLELVLSSKYIGRQYLDNTQSRESSIEPFTYSNVLAKYYPSLKFAKKASVTLQLNNIFNSLYESNGYSYSYYYGRFIRENFLYAQAGFNFMLGIQLKL